MSYPDSLFIKYFNPCSDQLDFIEKHIRGDSDERSLHKLINHFEYCNRCRRYYEYIISVEKGFKEFSCNPDLITPISLNNLPIFFQDEFANSLKRNLSKWIFQFIRSQMYKNGIIIKFFLDPEEIYSVSDSYHKSINIINSLHQLNSISPIELKDIKDIQAILNSLLSNQVQSFDSLFCSALESCLSLDDTNILPFFFYDQIFLKNNDISSAIEINKRALMYKPDKIIKSHLLNHRGILSHLLKKNDEAFYFFHESLRLHEHPNPHMNISVLEIYEDNLDLSYSHLLKAINLIDQISSTNLRKRNFNHFSNYISYHYNVNKVKLINHDNIKNTLSQYFGIQT